MTDIVFVEIISTVGLVLVAILQLRAERERRRRKRAEADRDRRQEEQRRDDMDMSIAKGRVMLACGELAHVTSIAVSGGHTNGNVEAAQREFMEARKAYDELETRLAKKYLKES